MGRGGASGGGGGGAGALLLIPFCFCVCFGKTLALEWNWVSSGHALEQTLSLPALVLYPNTEREPSQVSSGERQTVRTAALRSISASLERSLMLSLVLFTHSSLRALLPSSFLPRWAAAAEAA